MKLAYSLKQKQQSARQIGIEKKDIGTTVQAIRWPRASACSQHATRTRALSKVWRQELLQKSWGKTADVRRG